MALSIVSNQEEVSEPCFFIYTDVERENVFCTLCDVHIKGEKETHAASGKHTLALELHKAGRFGIRESYPDRYYCVACKCVCSTVGGICSHLTYGSCNLEVDQHRSAQTAY